MDGTVAITDHGWYEYLRDQGPLDEVNFWTPSAHFGFRGAVGTPFFFKLKAKYGHAICGFAFFARFARLPDWLAWETFGPRNGCATFKEMRRRIGGIRQRIDYHAARPSNEIGCILLAQPTFFEPQDWVLGPSDWPPANLRHKRYDITHGEGHRIYETCLERVARLRRPAAVQADLLSEPAPRYGTPQLVAPRLGQGIFRVAVLDAYGRACAATGEHSLPALEASHIQPYANEGPHQVSNGVLLRADIHRLFDQGYLTITTDHRLEVSGRLREDYQNGRTYYPLHGSTITVPRQEADRPSASFLEWHNTQVYRR
jgi:putative restriction endonuclease